MQYILAFFINNLIIITFKHNSKNTPNHNFELYWNFIFAVMPNKIETLSQIDC